ncbi:MAG: helix-turn-helix domain-containing protein [Bacteriovoracaceae bacterium]|nr:helix-turn-helix domain-containing protein [Bacteriovoracaceae bacterium]
MNIDKEQIDFQGLLDKIGADPMPFLSSAEAAKFLDVSVGTIRNWVSQGLLRPYKLGGKYNRYTREQLLQMLKVSDI